jgi:hypothetical protein
MQTLFFLLLPAHNSCFFCLPFFINSIAQSAREPYNDKEALLTPVYTNDSREVLICELRLPCSGHKSDWVIAGCALMLTTN